MNQTKPLLIAMGAVLRRLAVYAGTAFLFEISGHGIDWLIKSLQADPKTAAWVPATILVIEFIQKFIREYQKQP